MGIISRILGVMDKMVGFFDSICSCGQNGWCFYQQYLIQY